MRHLSARPDTVYQEVHAVIGKNKEEIEDTINYCIESTQISPSILTQTTLRYCDKALYWCELAYTDSQISYTFLYYAYLLRYYACLVQSQEEVTLSFLKGSNTVKGLGSGVVFPDTFIQNYFNQDSHLNVILALIFRDTKALDLYAQLSFKPSIKDFYEDQKSRKRDYPWIANYKKGGSPIYTYRQNWALADYFVVLASRDTEHSLEKTREMITFFTNEVDYYNQREKEDLSLWWGDGYKESDLTPYSTGCLPLLFQKQQIEELILPYLKVYQSVFENNEKGFNHNLKTALEKHKNYYENFLLEGEEIRSEHTGWLSMALIGACVIAYDKGMKRQVESDYIPNWIVKGDFEGLELVV
ncbi:MAG: immunity 49 family protein [Raineya sp.]|jgi:hypothetical protein|nr:immunity 49 family protein [Raineya sp.]